MADLNDIKLSAQDILKKQFRNKVKGYDPEEVDTYLDQVISDYETFQSIIEDLYGQIGELQGEVLAAKKEAQNAKNSALALSTSESQKQSESKSASESSSTSEVKETVQDSEVAKVEDTSTAEEIKTYTPTSQRNKSVVSNGEISTNMAIIQRLSTLERKVYNLEQRVYGLQN